jgi:hypothetical protein
MEDFMRIPAVILLSSLAALGACASHPHEHRKNAVPPIDMMDIYPVFPLSNGDVLKVSREHERYWAEMHNTGRFEIVPVAPTVFVEKGGGIRFTFQPLPAATRVRVDGVGDPAATALASAWGESSGVEREFGE